MNFRHFTAAAIAALIASPAAASAATVSTDGLDNARPATGKLASAAAKKRARGAAARPGDPNIGDQWALNGDSAMGTASAWRQTVGGDTTIAIVDSGANLRHRDLAPNLWTNAGEIAGNGADDDGNGFTDDVHGFDFVGGDGDPSDANGHGTHVAGIAGARGGNGIGGSGVAQRARLMIVRVLDADASGTTDTVAKGVRYAVDNGARIVNLSLAGPASSDDLYESMVYARDHGVLVVCATGNGGASLDSAPSYPASYDLPNVIGVAATNDHGRLAGISNYGTGADISAPGADIFSTAADGSYEWRTGTSMASPAVAGTLALLMAARPDLDADGLVGALAQGARHNGVGSANGSLDAAGALRRVVAPQAWRNAPATKATRPARAAAKKA